MSWSRVIVTAQDEAVNVVCEVTLHIQLTGAVAGHRRELHNKPVDAQEGSDPDELLADSRGQVKGGGDQVADGDALQDTQPPLGREVQRPGVDRKAEQIQSDRAPKDLREQLETRDSRCQAPVQRQGHGRAHDPKESGENGVRESPTVPLRVLQGPVGVRAIAGIVHQHHQRHGRTAKHIQRHKPLRGGLFPCTRAGDLSAQSWDHLRKITRNRSP